MPESPKNKRPPVVVVLGHVDHGKTTLLDYIRKSNVAEKESGGITQHIGAYQIEHPQTNADGRNADGRGRLITFLDTPGHEAFSEMRRRGAHVADLAVLVIAADEGIKPQTLEAARHIENAKLPFVVALNRIDKPNADPARVKKQLSENNILIEEWGGKVPAFEVSAKTGKGIPELLDMLLLLWDVEEVKEETPGSAQGMRVLHSLLDHHSLGEGGGEGVVIESRLDPRRGATATILVTGGILKKGDAVVCGEAFGKVRILEDFKGSEIDEALPSTPVLVTGLETVPTLGDTCKVTTSIEEARSAAGAFVQKRISEQKTSAASHPQADQTVSSTTAQRFNFLNDESSGIQNFSKNQEHGFPVCGRQAGQTPTLMHELWGQARNDTCKLAGFPSEAYTENTVLPLQFW